MASAGRITRIGATETLPTYTGEGRLALPDVIGILSVPKRGATVMLIFAEVVL
jgi:hypothetical protein